MARVRRPPWEIGLRSKKPGYWSGGRAARCELGSHASICEPAVLRRSFTAAAPTAPKPSLKGCAARVLVTAWCDHDRELRVPSNHAPEKSRPRVMNADGFQVGP